MCRRWWTTSPRAHQPRGRPAERCAGGRHARHRPVRHAQYCGRTARRRTRRPWPQRAAAGSNPVWPRGVRRLRSARRLDRRRCAPRSRTIVAGRLACPPEITGSLLRALFRNERHREDPERTNLALTRRESEVLELLGRGLSNKEIGNELCLSVATVKHHVHHVLAKAQAAATRACHAPRPRRALDRARGRSVRRK